MQVDNVQRFSGQRVTVMGLGQFGGGIGVVQFLLTQGARVTLTDLASQSQLERSLAQIDCSALEQLVLGEHRDIDFAESDLVVANPGIQPETNRFLQVARQHNVPVTTEMNLFWERCRARKVLVTGTVGKSTTAQLIHFLLNRLGMQCRLGGNIGISLLPVVESFTPDQWVVLELSSFQLEWLADHQPAADIAVLTNFFPNHLDWHKSLSNYYAAKHRAFCWQRSDQWAILNCIEQSLATSNSEWKTSARRIELREAFEPRTHHTSPKFEPDHQHSAAALTISDKQIVFCDDVMSCHVDIAALPPILQRPHNVQNVALAIAVCAQITQFDSAQLVSALQSFTALPHRMQPIRTISHPDGTGCVDFIDDSKATTPEATIAALNALPPPLFLIAGGKDKGMCLQALCEEIARKTHAVALIGETALTLQQHLAKFAPQLPTQVNLSLDEAVQWTMAQIQGSGTVLLSPACSSDRNFLNYEDRGHQFRQAVETFINSPKR